jgi:alkanesulfonate monooxygenase SsuD/methylene tetrahydromethanopterin reductase-like flavin-dependent oxidoreductase (luciferase family)
MQFGIFSNGNRNNKVAKLSYDEDLHKIIVADRLGMREAWISEHGTFLAWQAPDQLPCADLMICKAAALTTQIKMGPAIRPLPFFHPLQVATDAAVCDHLTGGRYFAGFGVGINVANNFQRGPMLAAPRKMFREAVELILTAWAAPEPFDWNGQVWQGKQWHIIPKPLTEIEVGIASSRTDTTIELTAEKSFLPLFQWTPSGEQIRNMLATYMATPRPRRPRRLRDRPGCAGQARARRRRPAPRGQPHAASHPAGWEHRRYHLRRPDRPRPILLRDPDTVGEQIARFHRDVGGFGTLLLVMGKDWGTREQRTRSMERFMAEVVPRLAKLDSDARRNEESRIDCHPGRA